MSSLRNQPTRLLKRRWLHLSREGLALIQEMMERAMAQEAAEEAYDDLALLAERCLEVLGTLKAGDTVTEDMAAECHHLLTQVRDLLSLQKSKQIEGDPHNTTVSSADAERKK